VDAGDLAVSVPDSAVVERPKSREHGDYATNVALRLAKPAGRPPREVAELVAARLREHPAVAAVDVAGPGFLNVTLAKDALAGLVRTILEAGPAYGKGEVNAGRHLNPRVRLGQPDRAAAPGARPVGRRPATRWPGC
jgi:arginyl-tRNA synthetase